MNLRFRNVFFSPDERGNGKIQNAEKGKEFEVGRDRIKEMINKGENVIVLPAEDNIRTEEKEQEQ